MKLKSLTYVPLILLLLCGCKQKSVHSNTVSLDGNFMKDWATQIILPAYQNYQSRCLDLIKAADDFNKTPTDATLATLKSNWEKAYLAFQKTMIFDFGYSQNIYYLQRSDTYPTQPQSTADRKQSIEQNIQLIKDGKANQIDLGPTSRYSLYTYQGFPALDYLLFGQGKTLDYYQNNAAARQYIDMLCQQLGENIDGIVKYWQSYKDQFGASKDTSVNGPFSSVVNAFIRVYEKQIRANKIGYAAGAIREQNGKAAPQIIEAYYKGNISKELLLAALHSSQDFFDGKTFDGKTQIRSLKQILIDKGQSKLAEDIDNQYTQMYDAINKYPYTLKEGALKDQAGMTHLYDLIQVNVLNYKTKMMAAMNIQPNYMDTDGD